MACDLLEPEAGQVPGAHVMELGKDPGVDDVAAGDLVAAITDSALGDLESRRAARELAPVAAPRQRHAVAACARFEILEVEAEDIVTFDDVGVQLLHDSHALPEQGGLVEMVAANHLPEAGGIGEGNGDDAIARPSGARELEAVRRHHLDVPEREAAERRASGHEQVLVHRVGKEEIGRFRCARRERGPLPATITRAHGVAPRFEAREPAEGTLALERDEIDQAGNIGYQ